MSLACFGTYYTDSLTKFEQYLWFGTYFGATAIHFTLSLYFNFNNTCVSAKGGMSIFTDATKMVSVFNLVDYNFVECFDGWFYSNYSSYFQVILEL
jgi:hypothetical protein